MPEWSGNPVRARAGTVDREEGAGVRRGTTRPVGHGGLKMEAAANQFFFHGENERCFARCCSRGTSSSTLDE